MIDTQSNPIPNGGQSLNIEDPHSTAQQNITPSTLVDDTPPTLLDKVVQGGVNSLMKVLTFATQHKTLLSVIIKTTALVGAIVLFGYLSGGVIPALLLAALIVSVGFHFTMSNFDELLEEFKGSGLEESLGEEAKNSLNPHQNAQKTNEIGQDALENMIPPPPPEQLSPLDPAINQKNIQKMLASQPPPPVTQEQATRCPQPPLHQSPAQESASSSLDIDTLPASPSSSSSKGVFPQFSDQISAIGNHFTAAAKKAASVLKFTKGESRSTDPHETQAEKQAFLSSCRAKFKRVLDEELPKVSAKIALFFRATHSTQRSESDPIEDDLDLDLMEQEYGELPPHPSWQDRVALAPKALYGFFKNIPPKHTQSKRRVAEEERYLMN